MDLLKALIVASEKAANIARLCRRNDHLFALLIQKKKGQEANKRFVEDFKTLADVLIQQIVEHDIGKRFPELKGSIFGEENNIFCNKLGETITVEIKENREETANLLRTVLNEDTEAAELLASEVHNEIFLNDVEIGKEPGLDFDLDLRDVGIWIDPIDSTAEYINGIEEVAASGISLGGLKCVTVLIGAFDKKMGLPVLGVVNQPFAHRDGDKWTGRCYWALPTETNLPSPSPSPKTICVSSSENPDVITKLKRNGYNLSEAAGAGYKILTVITGLADAYILTKDSTFKWDTCGPQAIIRSLGGDVVIYKDAVDGKIASVTYKDNHKTCNIGGIIAYRDEDTLKDIIKCLTT